MVDKNSCTNTYMEPNFSESDNFPGARLDVKSSLHTGGAKKRKTYRKKSKKRRVKKRRKTKKVKRKRGKKKQKGG